jgi:hypothetical protein
MGSRNGPLWMLGPNPRGSRSMVRAAFMDGLVPTARELNVPVAIPGVGFQDTAMIQSLLSSAGFAYHVIDGLGECSQAQILILEADVPAVKRFLAEYRLHDFNGGEYPIPW